MPRKCLNFIILLSSLLQFNLSRADIFFPKGRTEISLPGGITLLLKSYNHRLIHNGELGTWDTKLVVKRVNKKIKEIKSPTGQNLESLNHYFLPLRKDQYGVDVNGDGVLEIAILATSYGNRGFNDVYIYSFKNNELIFFKKGHYPEVNGEFVSF